tara:strand:- start:264 stop:449 length:186 start_codon:yes stop_codon:yes gene_type:complete
MVEGAGFEPAKHEAADLQSAGFDHSPTPPQIKNSGNSGTSNTPCQLYLLYLLSLVSINEKK